MKPPSRFLLTTVIIASISLLSCTKNGSTSSTTPTPTGTSGPNVKLITDAKFGSVLTDSAGKVLYFYSLDATATSSCTGGCVVAWPVFYKDILRVGTGLDPADFGVITRPDNSKQITYKGWPLYYYMGDSNAGQITGDNLGSVWFVAKPDYSVMVLNNILVGNDGVQYNSNYLPGQQTIQYITDPYGRTLYAFSPDRFKTNTYTKPDFSNNAFWPIDEISSIKNIPSVLDKSTFDTTAVFGKVQISYKGWPLYFFGPDNQQRGSTKGISVPTPGVWPIVNLSSTVAPL